MTREPVIFIHFHKCAGSFVTTYAASLDYKMAHFEHPDNPSISVPFNGNILFSSEKKDALRVYNSSHPDSKLYTLEIDTQSFLTNWTLSSFTEAENLQIFSYLLKTVGLEYIAFEDSLPSLGVMNKLSGCIKLALVRHPLKRLTSDYIYTAANTLQGANGCASLLEYARKGIGFAQPNMYTKQILSGQSLGATTSMVVTETDGVKAAHTLMEMTTNLLDPDRCDLSSALSQVFKSNGGNQVSLPKKVNSSEEHIARYGQQHLQPLAIDLDNDAQSEILRMNSADMAFYKELISLGAL